MAFSDITHETDWDGDLGTLEETDRLLSSIRQTQALEKMMDRRRAPSLLGTDTQTGKSVVISQEQRLKGLYIIGKTGSGKTTLLVNMILQDIQAGRGLCFFDTHGDAITDILRRLPSEREKDVILLDLLDDEYAFGLNIFQCMNPRNREEVSRITSQILSIFEKLFYEGRDMASEAPTLVETLENLIPVFLVNNMTLAEVQLFLDEEIVRKKFLTSVTNPIIQHFWRNFDRLKKNDQYDQVESTKRRINRFLTDPLALEIFGQCLARINLRAYMDEQKIILVKLSRQHEMLTAFVGNILVSLIANAAYSRADTPEEQRIPFHLYADEYQRFCTPAFAELLAEVRKYKIATCVAHQFRDQLDKANRGATLNAANLVVFQVSGDDAKELAVNFKRRPYPVTETRREELLTPVSDVLGHVKNRGGARNPFVNEFLHKYKLLDASEYGFLFSRANRGVPLNKLIQTEEEKTLLFTMARQHVYATVKEKLTIPLSLLEYDDGHYYEGHIGVDECRSRLKRNPAEYIEETSEKYKQVQFYLNLYEYAYYQWKDRWNRSHMEKLDKEGYRGYQYDINKDPTRDLLFALFTTASSDPYVWLAMSPASQQLEQFVRQVLTRLRAYNQRLLVMVVDPHYIPLYQMSESEQEAIRKVYAYYPFEPNGRWTSAEKRQSLLRREVDDIIRQQKPLVEQFIFDLSKVLRILSTDPIVSGSGTYQEKPIELSSAEIGERIADKLANPDKPYTAWCKLGLEEHILQVQPYPPADSDAVWQERKKRIIEQTRNNKYCKKRDDVDKEILLRHEALIRRQPPTAQATSDDDEEE